MRPETQNKRKQNDRGNQVLFLISTVHHRIQRRLEQSLKAELDGRLSVSHADILMYLSLNGEATASELAEFLGLTKSTLTSLLNKLEDLNYISRQADSEDRRRLVVYPTELLHTKMARARLVGELVREEVLANLSKKERQQLASLLDRIL